MLRLELHSEKTMLEYSFIFEIHFYFLFKIIWEQLNAMRFRVKKQ